MAASRRVWFERIRPFHRVVGVALAAVGGSILFGGDDSPTALAWGGGLLVFGAVLAVARGGTYLDFDDRQVVAYLGLVVPWSREKRPFSSLSKVALEGRKRGRNSVGAQFEFPIELRGEGPDVRLVEPTSYARARRLARTLANRMSLALVDHGDERAPGLADEPLRDRLLRTGAVPGREKLDAADPYRLVTATREPPPAPAGTKIVVEDTPSATRFVVPARFRPSWICAATVVFGVTGAIPLLDGVDDPHLYAYWTFPFWMVGLVVLVPWLLRQFPTRVVVDGEGICIRRAGRTQRFSFSELDDVHRASAEEPRYGNLTSRFDVPAAWPFVVVRSEARATPVAVGRPVEELDWLVARIQHAIFVHSTGARSRV